MGNEKRVFLHVSGDDHSAMVFSREYNTQDFYEQMVKDGVTEKVVDEDDFYAEIEIKEFRSVDEEFIEFIRDNFIDYDYSKDSDFFEVTPVK